MPIVLVHTKKHAVPTFLLTRLGEVICASVAKAFTVPSDPELKLTPNEVEVRFTDSGPFDVCHHDIGIMIFGNGGTERQKNLADRTEEVRDNISELFAYHDYRCRFYVYAMLQNAHYVEVRP